jgi:hypothetical protein
METKTEEYSYENIMRIFRIMQKNLKKSEKEAELRKQDLDRRFQETDRKFQETEKMFQETDLQFKETALRFKETDKQFKESKELADKLDRQLARSERFTKKRIDYLDNLFTGQWGKLVETLIEGKLIKMLKQRGIDVEYTYTNLYSPEKDMEIDIIAANGKDVVVVEVKTTLKIEDLNYFINKLKRFKTEFPKYSDTNLLGAVAYLKGHPSVIRHSEKEGLFVIKATGDSAFIINRPEFIPRAW